MSGPSTDKWSAPDSGERYSTGRFASRRAAARDPRIVRELLGRFGVRGPILDAPCGTGRLREVLAGFGAPVTSLDRSRPMLEAAREHGLGRAVLASLDTLPFRDGAFDVVVSCRFLHHLHERNDLDRAVSELVRVSSRLVVASFWDSSSLPAWRVRAGLKRPEGERGRVSISRAEIASAVERAGARVLAFRAVLRFVSQQTFLVAERPPARRA
jgi:SAM-dependent methyltransferase